ncbi:thioesterase II family protein [Kitasatospora azatica]|uniref:thioesterase II family protein n=1 Tax=Kitasatospora azatica TaxID=58347 RepID=UPI00056426DF|nr:thioesterase II family protein [Kitasatospora azatica]
MTVAAAGTDPWIRRYHPSPEAAVRLVCFPHAGGSGTFYFPVSAAMPTSVEVLAVQYPGRQDRRSEPSIEDIAPLADQIFDALQAWTDRPLAFFGHSMGAVLAFEVARRFQDKLGAPPVVLFASGRRAPDRYRDENVHSLDDDGLIREMQRLNGTDAQLLSDEELLRMILPALRSDYRAIEAYRYVPGAKLDCPIVMLTGDADPMTSIDEARAWQEHTSAAFELEVFPGGHFYLAAQQQPVLRTISDHLARHTKNA